MAKTKNKTVNDNYFCPGCKHLEHFDIVGHTQLYDMTRGSERPIRLENTLEVTKCSKCGHLKIEEGGD